MARFVLIHGAFSGGWIWGPLIHRLNAAGHSAEAFDLPGCGEDRTPPIEVTLDSCAIRLCEVLDLQFRTRHRCRQQYGRRYRNPGSGALSRVRKSARVRNSIPSKGRSESP
jgi:pimeloyl-ACP methyl ester carboxylesterase